ncbi:MAG: hypothetical protein HUJ31_10800 [Pseudomonadales bacterium]|nr:hypothetical protein [Pseudomonadales bacterium]
MAVPADRVVERLLEFDEPSIRWKMRIQVLGEDPDSSSITRLREEIRQSPLVHTLMQDRGNDGRFRKTRDVYSKWQGIHWIMAVLADNGYPEGDAALIPARDQLQAKWLGKNFYEEFSVTSRAAAYRGRGVPVMEGRHRRCASQQSNALWSIVRLGLVNEQTHDLVERLLHWQWPDGGWNCDKNPSAHHSSFMESILPLRAMALYGRVFDHQRAREAAARCAEIFLKRSLFIGQSTNKPIKAEFTALHYPLYWHYDILHGLKVMAESGFIDDPRCEPALDLLEHKQLPDGGWPAERKYYKSSSKIENGNDYVDWGGAGKGRMNPWVTADALFVLKASGRLL